MIYIDLSMCGDMDVLQFNNNIEKREKNDLSDSWDNIKTETFNFLMSSKRRYNNLCILFNQWKTFTINKRIEMSLIIYNFTANKLKKKYFKKWKKYRLLEKIRRGRLLSLHFDKWLDLTQHASVINKRLKLLSESKDKKMKAKCISRWKTIFRRRKLDCLIEIAVNRQIEEYKAKWAVMSWLKYKNRRKEDEILFLKSHLFIYKRSFLIFYYNSMEIRNSKIAVKYYINKLHQKYFSAWKHKKRSVTRNIQLKKIYLGRWRRLVRQNSVIKTIVSYRSKKSIKLRFFNAWKSISKKLSKRRENLTVIYKNRSQEIKGKYLFMWSIFAKYKLKKRIVEMYITRCYVQNFKSRILNKWKINTSRIRCDIRNNAKAIINYKQALERRVFRSWKDKINKDIKNKNIISFIKYFKRKFWLLKWKKGVLLQNDESKKIIWLLLLRRKSILNKYIRKWRNYVKEKKKERGASILFLLRIRTKYFNKWKNISSNKEEEKRKEKFYLNYHWVKYMKNILRNWRGFTLKIAAYKKTVYYSNQYYNSIILRKAMNNWKLLAKHSRNKNYLFY